LERVAFLPYQWRLMIQFSLFNIPIRVEPWFWVLMVFAGGGMYADTRQELFRLMLFIVAGFISFLVHELGHALTAKHYGQKREIVLHGMGGLAIYTGGRHLSRSQDFQVILGGPVFELVLGGLAFLAYRQIPESATDARYFLWVLQYISIIWALVNLLPLYPLDGGLLLDTVLGPSRKRITLSVSVATGAAICAYCFIVVFQPLFGALAGYFAYKSFKSLQQPSWR
jgi:membrane-associated protease RseP (regulator of RpoE activity)